MIKYSASQHYYDEKCSLENASSLLTSPLAVAKNLEMAVCLFVSCSR